MAGYIAHEFIINFLSEHFYYNGDLKLEFN